MGPTHDQAGIDALVARFYRAFDNRRGRRPTVTDVVRCFADKATIARHGDGRTDLYTAEEFAQPRIALLAGGSLVDFHEAETGATTQVFDGIAVRTSRYGKSGLLDGVDYAGTGTKCFQFVIVDAGWRIAALAWVDDPV